MSMFTKGYQAAADKAKEVKEKLENANNAPFPFLSLTDSQADPDPDGKKYSMVYGRFLDNEPINFNVYQLEKGSVRFIDFDENPLRQTEHKPSLKGVFPFLVYPTTSPEFQDYLASIEDEEIRDDVDQRILKIDQAKVYRAEFSFKVLNQLAATNKRKKIDTRDVFVTRVGGGANDTTYQFEFSDKSDIAEAYVSLELPDWEKVYRIPSREEVLAYIKGGKEELQKWRKANLSKDKADKPAPKASSKKKHVEELDEDEVDFD